MGADPRLRGVGPSGITSLKGIARELNARGILTARWGHWYATSVKALLAGLGQDAHLSNARACRLEDDERVCPREAERQFEPLSEEDLIRHRAG